MLQHHVNQCDDPWDVKVRGMELQSRGHPGLCAMFGSLKTTQLPEFSAATKQIQEKHSCMGSMSGSLSKLGV